MTAVVVGGGIAGLTAAYALGRAGVPTTLIEASGRLGGKIRTETVDGFIVESGPDSFIAIRPAAAQLCRELGLGDELVGTQEPRRVHVWRDGRHVPMPDGLALVLPTKFIPFATTRLFGPFDKLRMALDLMLPRGRADGDEAVGRLLRRRLGDALVERLAGPLVGGIYGTPIDELSLLAVLPQLRAAERDHRSLLLASVAEARGRRARERVHAAARQAAAVSAPSAPQDVATPRSVFLSLRGGMERLVAALAGELERTPGTTVRLGASVVAIQPEGGAYVVRLSDGTAIDASGLVLAAPAPAAASLVEPFAPDAAAALRSIPYGSAAIVTFAYPAAQVGRPLVGHGFVVAADDGLPLTACTVSSAKWPGRAPVGTVLLRAFLRTDGPGSPPPTATDDAVIATARAAVERTLGVHGEPSMARIARWDGAMPRYTVGHLDRVAAAEAALSAHPGIALAGAAYRGVGLPDCIAQGRAAARQIAALG